MYSAALVLINDHVEYKNGKSTMKEKMPVKHVSAQTRDNDGSGSEYLGVG